MVWRASGPWCRKTDIVLCIVTMNWISQWSLSFRSGGALEGASLRDLIENVGLAGRCKVSETHLSNESSHKWRFLYFPFCSTFSRRCCSKSSWSHQTSCVVVSYQNRRVGKHTDSSGGSVRWQRLRHCIAITTAQNQLVSRRHVPHLNEYLNIHRQVWTIQFCPNVTSSVTQ